MSNQGYIPQPKYIEPDPDEALDEFFTPDDVVFAAFTKLRQEYPAFDPVSVFEPGCGEGAHLDRAVMDFPNVDYTLGLDDYERDISHDFVHEDFLNFRTSAFFDLVVTNPPFTYAEHFIRKAHSLLTPSGLGVFLCKYSIAGCKRRMLMWRDEINLRNVWLIAPRPSFRGTGTDATEYAYFVFDKGQPTPDFKGGWLNWKEMLQL